MLHYTFLFHKSLSSPIILVFFFATLLCYTVSLGTYELLGIQVFLRSGCQLFLLIDTPEDVQMLCRVEALLEDEAGRTMLPYLRCVRHNYSDFRDTHSTDLEESMQEGCLVGECIGPFNEMFENCPENMTHECLKASHLHYIATELECLYLPNEIPKSLYIPIPSLYELRISDDLFLQNQLLVREWRGIGREKLKGPEFFYEMEKSIDWCSDGSKGRYFNGTYVLCREEKDVWRVMSEFGRRAPHCIRYYIRQHFRETKQYDGFMRDMTEECSTFENKMKNNKENDFIKAHTTERHSLAINTFNACCFLKKAEIIERFPCVEEVTTPWPETPAPTVELRNESNILVLSIEENGLNSYCNMIVLFSVLLFALC